MAFLRVDNKKSGKYLRIVKSYKEDGMARHVTLYSLGKAEDYTADQLERMAKKLMALAGRSLEGFCGGHFKELGRYNYGYALVVRSLWRVFDLSKLSRIINNGRKVKFNWEDALRIMIAERMNDPCSKLQNSLNQSEYIGLTGSEVQLHHFYRTLDIMSGSEQLIKQHLFTQQHSLFSTVLDVVFYDVTTLYFESQVEKEDRLRQKGYSKDGKAHRTQIVLGLLVDKNRNPITYHLYQGNTYEGGTMIDALAQMKSRFTIDKVVVVADSAMIDKGNRAFMEKNGIDYIIGDSIKGLGKKIQARLMDKSRHEPLFGSEQNTLTYSEATYKGRRIICTYSSKRARKDAHQRQKLIDKAKDWLETPSKYKQTTKRGAGRFIKATDQGEPIALDMERIGQDQKFDGFKAIATVSELTVEDILGKYRDLFEVEHSFRALKSQLEIRPMFHWTDKRIIGHVCMSFMAFTFINYIRNLTSLQYREIIRAIDLMQLSKVEDKKANNHIYLRSKVDGSQQILIDKLGLKIPLDANPQNTINQYFT